jgi:selenocysteine lyase/cysteine desulfurase
MLTRTIATASLTPEDLRRTEFSRLDERGIAYLDYGGAALYGESQIDAHHALLSRALLGNPHSEHGASRASTTVLDAARRRILSFFDAVGDYDVIFTANASAAIKLVAEAYPFGPDCGLVLAADNHNSVNGIREFAWRAGATVLYLPLRDDLRLYHPEARLAQAGGPGLFAFPAQSNFSGVRHPLSLVRRAQELGHHVLLDAAAFTGAHTLSLRACPADFVALSFYKMFGYPTGVGALLARREALTALRRPWFAGGTVAYASVQLGRHRLRERHEAFEDGTANFLDVAALDAGFALLERVGLDTIASHTRALTRALVDRLRALAHCNGQPLVRLYGPLDPLDDDVRGATLAFNVLDRFGVVVPYQLVERRADAANVHVRGGCFCNPGAAEAALRLDASRMTACIDRLGERFSIARLQRCLGRGTAAGAIRASLGLANTRNDIDRLIDVVASFAG